MDREAIIKLLCSTVEEDNLLALNILRSRNPNNWGGFLMELQNITQGYFYPTKSRGYGGNNTWMDIEVQHHLRNKYFRQFDNNTLQSYWEDKID